MTGLRDMWDVSADVSGDVSADVSADVFANMSAEHMSAKGRKEN